MLVTISNVKPVNSKGNVVISMFEDKTLKTVFGVKTDRTYYNTYLAEGEVDESIIVGADLTIDMKVWRIEASVMDSGATSLWLKLK